MLGPEMVPSGGLITALRDRKLRRVDECADGYEPGGRRFESCWARHKSFKISGLHRQAHPVSCSREGLCDVARRMTGSYRHFDVDESDSRPENGRFRSPAVASIR